MRKGHKAKLPPWKKPGQLIWLFLALIFSAYLMTYMPESSRSTSTSTSSKTTQNVAQLPTPTTGAQQKAAQPLPSTQQPPLEVEKPQAKTSPATMSTKKKNAEKSLWKKFLTKLQSFTRLFTIVSIAAFVGAIIELRCWHRFLAKFMGKLTRLARLPEVVGLAMPTALVSTAAANTMLVASHTEGHIRTSALIAGGMANSYLSYISHSLRVIIPVVLTIGMPGILFFSIQFSGGFIVILAVFIWNRYRFDNHTPYEHSPLTQQMHFEVTPWKTTIQKALVRSLSLVFRLACITVPLMLGIEWLLKNGTFDFWNELVPANIHKFFPVEAISIVATQIGGLIQSSAVAAHLRAEGLITNAQILLAMLVASAVGNPIRSMRRNLATSLAIFPPNIACTIVFTMQFSRVIVALLGAGAAVFYIHTS